MNFYKHYIGDYQRDTGHLSLTEHGAYRLMLDAFYATGKPLPADKRALYRLVRAGSRQDRLAVDSVAAQFWETADGGLVNRRACVEIARAEKQAEVNRQIALAREERRRLQRQLAPGGSFAGGNGGLAGCQGDHASAEVSEVCKVHDTQVIYGLQPFMVTNRATSGCTGMGTTVVAAACAPGAPTGSPDGIGGSDHGAGDGGICRRAGEGAGMDGVCQAAGVAVSAGNVPVPRGGDDGVAGEVVGGACDGDAGMVGRMVFRRVRWWGCCGVMGWWRRCPIRGCGRWWRRGWIRRCWRRLVWRRGGCVRMSGSGWLMWRGS